MCPSGSTQQSDKQKVMKFKSKVRDGFKSHPPRGEN